MGSTTGIEWADATVNIWTGCTKVSPACKHCYAETDRAVLSLGARVRGKGLPMWGDNGYRYETVGWEQQLRAANRKARGQRALFTERLAINPHAAQYARPRIFINSLSDTFEDFQGDVFRLEDGKPALVAHSLDGVRQRFFRVAEECTELDILLLTKRPENVLGMLPYRWYGTNDFARTHSRIPEHIWFGATVEDQERADKRIPELLKVPAEVRFLSVEPLLGPVDLAKWFRDTCNCMVPAYEGAGQHSPKCDTFAKPWGNDLVHWVIVGGESGRDAGPMHPDWARSIRDQCVASGVPFFFKQWGEYVPDERMFWDYQWWVNKARSWLAGTKAVCIDKLGRRMNIGADFMKSHEEGTFPVSIHYPVGKKAAGRLLDGRTWDEVPK